MKKRIVLVIALMLGLVSALTVYQFLSNRGDSYVLEEKTKVVLALKEIQPKERITLDHVILKEISREMAHYQSATGIEQVVGHFAKDQILEGEQILLPRLIKGFEDYGIVAKIPSGFRAITVPVDNVIGVGGFIRPGDYVDVIAGFDEMVMGENVARVILEKTLVLAIDQDLAEDNRKPADSETVTLAVTLEQAQKLSLAMDHGIIRLVLRPIEGSKVDSVGELAVKDIVTKPEKVASSKTAQNLKPLSQLTSTPKTRPVNDSTTSSKAKSLNQPTSEKVSETSSQSVKEPRPEGNSGTSSQTIVAINKSKNSNPVTITNSGNMDETGVQSDDCDVENELLIEIIRGTERYMITVKASREEN